MTAAGDVPQVGSRSVVLSRFLRIAFCWAKRFSYNLWLNLSGVAAGSI